MSHPISGPATDAVTTLGLQIAQARRRARRTAADVAERAGISRPTLRRIENGDPNVAIGTVFEVASLLGVPLFAERDRLEEIVARQRDRLALLPARVHPRRAEVDDDF